MAARAAAAAAGQGSVTATLRTASEELVLERDRHARSGRSGGDRRCPRGDTGPGRLRGDAGDPRWWGDRERLGEDAWIIHGVGDFNADGATDLLWSNTDKSQMAIWLMAATCPPAGSPDLRAVRRCVASGLGDGLQRRRHVRRALVQPQEPRDIHLPHGRDRGPRARAHLFRPGRRRLGASDVPGRQRRLHGRSGLAQRVDRRCRNLVDERDDGAFERAGVLLAAGSRVDCKVGGGLQRRRHGRSALEQRRDRIYLDRPDERDSAAPARGGDPRPTGSGWRVVLATDFNADGMADVLWFNPITRGWKSG